MVDSQFVHTRDGSSYETGEAFGHGHQTGSVRKSVNTEVVDQEYGSQGNQRTCSNETLMYIIILKLYLI